MTTAQHTQRDAATRFLNRPVYHPALAPRVLVVAKDEPFRQWALGQLRESGFEIVLADDGFAASLTVASDPPDLIVIDHSLPWFGVISLLSRMRDESALGAVPVLLVAPRATESLVEACRALGVGVLVRCPGAPTAVLDVRSPRTQATLRGVGAEVADSPCARSP